MSAKYAQKCFRIHANGTTTVYDKDCYFDWAKIAVVDGGTSWVLKVQDKATPDPNVLLCGSWATNDKDSGITFFQAPEPVLMRGGIDIVAAGGTAGDIYLWLFGWAQTADA